VTAALLALGLVAGCGGGSSKPTFNEADAKAQVKANWEAFFDPAKSEDDHVALIEGGETLRAAVKAAAKNPLAAKTKTTVTNVVVDPGHTTATVTYNIALNGTNVVDGGVGQAVYQDGKWKVSRDSFCGLANAGAPGTCPS
jgi:hypothetical protein